MRAWPLLAMMTAAVTAGQPWFHRPSVDSVADSTLEGLIDRAKQLTDGKLNEAGIGFCSGAAVGFACKQAQNFIVSTAVASAAVACGACAIGWASPEDLQAKAQELRGAARNAAEGIALPQINKALLHLDTNGDGKVDLQETKVTLSKFIQRHRGLSGGFAGGLLVGYRLG